MPLPGFRDFYPEQFAERAHIVETWRRIVRRYAFQEYDGPPLEPLELYTQKSGEEIVGQLYHFEDKGGRAVALRPEMTPTLARLVGARAQALRKPVRWFSMPQLFRYERTQKGRLREHFQLNVDIVGEADVLADAELLAVAVDIMRAFGLTARDVRARVSDRRLLNGVLAHLGVPDASWPAVYAVLDKLERQPVARSRELLAGAGVAGAVAEEILGFGTLDFEALQARYGDAPMVAEPAAPPWWRSRRRALPGIWRTPGRWGPATGSASTSPSSAGWRTTPASCSSCLMRWGSSGPSAAAAATTRCSPPSAGPTSPRWGSAWATWCCANCWRSAD
jgi:hypothetical protein